MRNEKGLSLIEVLATLTITAVLLGVIFMLMNSVDNLFNDTEQQQSDRRSIKFATNTITKEMADAVEVLIYGDNELRYAVMEGNTKVSKSLVYDPPNKKLSIYKSNGTDLLSGTYTETIVLAENVAASPNEPDPFAFLAGNTPLANNHHFDGEGLFTVKINFETPRIGASSQSIMDYKNVSINVNVVKEEVE